MKKSSVSFVVAAAALGLFAFTACASNTYDRAGSAAQSLQSSADLIATTRAQLTRVGASLQLLKRDGDLAKYYNIFVEQVATLEKSAAAVAASATKMTANQAAYAKQWTRDLEKIENTRLREASQSRLDEINAGFANIRARYEETRAAFVPFLTDLKDIRTALGADLTPAGAERIKPFIDDALTTIEPVKTAVEKLAADFNAFGVTLQPATSPETP